ncbi:MAG TPA: hypothetical protein PK073_14065 [Ignavibacteriaceae bacterium]|nr:hypothetical protein [Ignavibacteriaceae bacterium]
MYRINNVEYNLKEKFSLNDWGKILNIIADTNPKDEDNAIVLLLSDNRIERLLTIILDKPLDGEIYEEDFPEVNKIITDFFSRKKSLMKSINNNLPDSMKNT